MSKVIVGIIILSLFVSPVFSMLVPSSSPHQEEPEPIQSGGTGLNKIGLVGFALIQLYALATLVDDNSKNNEIGTFIFGVELAVGLGILVFISGAWSS